MKYSGLVVQIHLVSNNFSSYMKLLSSVATPE